MVKKLRNINLYSSYALFASFIISGFCLIKNKEKGDEFLRLSGRANHIYILFISILNYIYGIIHMESNLYTLIIRLLMCLSGICSVIGFFYETGASVDGRKIIPSAIGFSFISIVLFLIKKGKQKIH